MPSFRRGTRAIVTVAVGAAAAALFVWSVRGAGARAVVEGVRRAGPWFGVVLILGGVRHLARAAAWRQALDPPRRLPWRSAFLSALAGNAVGVVTPLGLLASEPSKVAFASLDAPAGELAAALALENLIYAATVVAMIVGGLATLLVTSEVSPRAQGTVVWVMVGTLAMAAALAAMAILLRRPMAARVGRWRRGQVASIVAIDALFHAAAVAEIWIVVGAITGAFPSVRTAFVLESVNRAVTAVFQFVPLWLGVDEASSALAASLLQLAPASGVSLALVRKARILCWTAAGLSIAVTRARSRLFGSR